MVVLHQSGQWMRFLIKAEGCVVYINLGCHRHRWKLWYWVRNGETIAAQECESLPVCTQQGACECRYFETKGIESAWHSRASTS